MVRHKLLLLLMLCLIFITQSCIHGDLDDCPPMVQYAVAFKYTYHTATEDRFYDDVKKINLFVFDDNKLIYMTDMALGPYEDNFNIPLKLPMGNYKIIAWGNVLDSEPFSITPGTFEQNRTTLDEARLILRKTAEELNNTELEKLFYGEIDAAIPLYVSRIDTVPLMNNTERVRVVLHWDHTGLSEDEIVDYSNVVVRINGTNAVYKFDNSRVLTPVIYAPFDTYEIDSISNEDWLNIYYYSNTSFKEVFKSYVYDFTVLRMFKDIPLDLSVEYWVPIGDTYDKHVIANVDIISRNTGFEYLFSERLYIPESRWQETFDINELYRIDMYITQERGYPNTFVTGDIKVEDWHRVDYVEGGGAD